MHETTTIPSEPLTVPGEPIVAAGWERRAGFCPNALPPGARVNEFEVLDVLGEGGFGIVYRARDHSLNRTVALKEFMPVALSARSDAGRVSVRSGEHVATFLAGLRSFVNEAKLLAEFDHPSLVKVYRFCEANGTAYMAMPLYEGATLRQVLRERRVRGAAPDEAWLRALLDPLLEALATLHRANCLHRDVSPDNIILIGGDLPQPRPVLLDLGAARRVIGAQTQALTVILKPGFAPIEQYDEIPGMKQGPWTDLYALAAVVHDAIVGQPPPSSVRRAMQDTYEPLAAASARLPARYDQPFLCTIDAALAPLPGDRLQDVVAWRALLNDTSIANHPPAAASSDVPRVSPRRERVTIARRAGNVDRAAPPKRRRRLSVAMLVAAYLAVGLALLASRSGPAPLVMTPVDRAVATAPMPPADAGPPRDEASVDSPPQDQLLRPPQRSGAPAFGGAPDPGPRSRVQGQTGGPIPPDEEDGLAGTQAWVRLTLREARQCLVARRYACTIERAEQVLKTDPEQPVAVRLVRRGREGLAGSATKKR